MARLMQISRVRKFIYPTICLRQLHCDTRKSYNKLALHSTHTGITNPSVLRTDLRKFAKQITSQCRQNYHEECEAAVNDQINLELYSSHVYLSMAHHFDRPDVALKGFHNFFKTHSDDERFHAEKLMKLQNQRGGRIELQKVNKPAKGDWGSGLEAMEEALELEKNVNQSLLDLHKIAGKHGDTQLAEFIEEHFLTEQVETIKSISDFMSILKKNGPGLGEYLFDVNTLQKIQN